MVEKKLTLAFLLALALQSGGVFVWAGATAERIAQLEDRVAESRPLHERLARVEAQLEGMRIQLDRIENKVDAR